MSRTHLFPLLAMVACADQDKGVTVHNTAPNAAIDSPVDGASFDQDEPVTFAGMVGDNEDAAETLIVTWSSDVNGILQEGIAADASGETQLTTSALDPGEHLIVLHVADTRGKSTEDMVSILMVDSTAAPEIHILRPTDGDVGSATSDFNFEAAVTDADDLGPQMNVSFWYDSDDGEMLLCESIPNIDGLATCGATMDAGVYDLIATVIDTDGNLSQDRFQDFTVRTAEEMDDDGDGYSEDDGDCDDTDDNVHPGAPEVANGIDDDCDGDIDEGTDDFDDDGDGYSELEGDCHDGDETIFPGAEESLNEIDDDCDGTVDENTDAYDDDGDCFCETAPCTGTIATDCDEVLENDCDDGDEDIHPDATETCDDIDNDCDDLIDAEDSDTDTDGDGYSACDSEDCNDSNAAISPGATEICDEIDNDCDGSIDESSASDASTWYADTDGDGYGNPDVSEIACDVPEGYTADDSDCDDLDEDIHPDAIEVCDEDDDDEDCDGSADDDDAGGATGKTVWFRDIDGDGYGDSAPSSMTSACDQPYGYVDNNADCDDWEPDAHPAMIETCDGIDNDCNDGADEADAAGCENYYMDADGDGFGHETDRRCLCEPADGYEVTNNTDCCDLSAETYPEATDWHAESNECGSHDWNCDDEDEQRWTTTGECGSGLGFDVCFDDPAGWLYGYVAPCGSSWAWLYDCEVDCDWWDCSCNEQYYYSDQNCR